METLENSKLKRDGMSEHEQSSSSHNIIVQENEKNNELKGGTSGLRLDLPWTVEVENQLLFIHKSCTESSVKHNQARSRAKCKYTIFGLPSMLIPLITGGIGAYLPADYDWVRSAALIVTAVNSGVLQFFNFGQKQTKHNESSGRYSELADTIKMELSKPQSFRVSCDVFMERVFVKMQNINATAPVP